MGHRTSVYLSDDLDAAWRASGLPLSELVRRGLGVDPPLTEATLREVLAEMLPPGGYATSVHTGYVAPIAAAPADAAGTTHVLTAVEAYDEPPERAPCVGGRHPATSIDPNLGICHECGQEVD